MNAITVENLAKRYSLGIHRAGYNTFRDKISSLFAKNREVTPQSSEHWALKDVSFEIKEGEVVGLIGRNGAGKSTLLKILSRITCPTQGKITMKGRLASLLEVGTGFHPELTGRENIYLNGAILGMTRAEVKANFDQIVAFSQVEKFLDTQVKFYSSGMYVRLAFAVAAHLTPEILLVDEVLAVGDQEFQRRCLGKMREVAQSGRTVIFVSHSMPAVESLCTRAIYLAGGDIVADGTPRQVISTYLTPAESGSCWDVRDVTDREGNGRARFTKVELLHATDESSLTAIEFSKPFRLRMHYEALERIESPVFGIAITTDRDERIFITDNVEAQFQVDYIEGQGSIDCVLQQQWLLPGTYQVEAWIADIRWSRFVDHLRPIAQVEVTIDSNAPFVSDLTLSGRGNVFCPASWSTTNCVTTRKLTAI